MPSSARPWRLTNATSCNDQPNREAARLNDDGCGRQIVSSAETDRSSMSPTP